MSSFVLHFQVLEHCAIAMRHKQGVFSEYLVTKALEHSNELLNDDEKFNFKDNSMSDNETADVYDIPSGEENELVLILFQL